MVKLDERGVPMECMKMAVSLLMQLKLPKESAIGVAQQFYDFVMTPPKDWREDD
jgi:hypothetical protein